MLSTHPSPGRLVLPTPPIPGRLVLPTYTYLLTVLTKLQPSGSDH